MFSLLIKNAKVIDGTGTQAYKADVAVTGDQISSIAPVIDAEAQSVVDASGKILSPGFIDIQNHSDVYWHIFDNPQLDSLITQGYTSILVGGCGASLAPLLSPAALLSIQKWHNLEGTNINWQSFSEYIEALSRTRTACNIASLVGYSTLRRGMVGDDIRRLEKNEIAGLQKALMESLEAGAFGLSSGLSYAHEMSISEIELFELAKTVKKYNSLMSIHLRSEGSEVVEALEESLDIARSTDANIKISHLKVRGEQNFSKMEQVVNILDTAYHQGLHVHFDSYPYDTIWQVIYSYLPKWAIEGGRTVMLKHFNNPVQRNKILTYLNNSGVKFSDLIIASTSNNLNFTGKTLGQVASNLEVSSEQAVLHLIQNGGSEILVFEKNLNEQHVDEFISHPLSFIATDGGGFSQVNKAKLVHPRCFGTAPKVLKMAREQKHLSLEETVFKLTSGPAQKMGLKKRGAIVPGNFADLVIFDEKTVADKSTYENPYQFSHGIEYVFVNGQSVVQNGKITGTLPGYTLRKG